MVIDIEQIREEEFILFRTAVRRFYKSREDEYFDQFKDKIENGEIDPDDPDYKEICKREAKTYMSSRPQKLLIFIRDYVDIRSSEILDAVSDKKCSKGKGKLQLEVLKYVLLAGEEDSLK
jgi:hypothetical protein